MFRKMLLIGTLIFSAGSAAAVFNSNKQATTVEAASTTNYPGTGQSGQILYVTGYGSFFGNQAKLAICCWNNSGYAWSDAVDYCCYGSLMRIMLPYRNGQSDTWSYFKVCRYNPNLNPKESTDYGVYNQTEDIAFSSMFRGHNTIMITGYGDGNRLNYSLSKNDYYGIEGEEHVYLDLSGFPDWDSADAKFAIWFGAPNTTDESRWGQSKTSDGYTSSFCWKVNGQTNEHLYECIVPTLHQGSGTIWNFVTVLRINPVASEPTWDQSVLWNKTQDLHFNPDNEAATMIRITGWDNSGELDTENNISKADRLEYFGRYFLNAVQCSGDGESDATTSDMWNAVKYEYQTHLARLYQGDVWTAEGDIESTSLLKQAVARYDYIVLYKQYAHDDFINRAKSPNAPTSNYMLRNDDFDYMPNILVVIISVSLASVVLITLLKVKRHKQ